jgi:hypothetical protein
VHPRCVLAVDVHPVDPHVGDPRRGVLRYNEGKGEKTPAVLWPALENRKPIEIGVLDDLMAEPAKYALRPRRPHTGPEGPRLPYRAERGRIDRLDNAGELFAELARVHPEDRLDVPRAPHDVDGETVEGALHALEEKRRPLLADHAGRDLGHLEQGVDLDSYAPEHPARFEVPEIALKIFERKHRLRILRSNAV